MVSTQEIVVSIVILLVTARAQLPNPRFPLRVESITVGADSPRSCPSSDALQSARMNITAAIRSTMSENLPCGIGNWRQVASLDMENLSEQCPSPWVVTPSPERSCASSISGQGCEGVSFSVSGGPYSRVCGRAIGYGVNSPDGFIAFGVPNVNIDTPYMDGMSVTYGSPRQHVWSFGAGHGGNFRCPCDNENRGQAPLPPSFVGDNYFCDGNYNGALWDAMDCMTACCTFNSPPYFTVSLPTPTSDDIEVRICADQLRDDEAIHVRLLQLYVQ